MFPPFVINIAPALISVAGVVFLSAPSVAQSAPLETVPATPAIQSIIDAFGDYDVVAFGENHSMTSDDLVALALLDHPEFPHVVDDIVIEPGNALYQPILDRYIAGEDVLIQEVQQVWRKTTHCIMGVGDSPFYMELLAKVRAMNQTHWKDNQVRVLAGDPPIDWDAVKTRRDWEVHMNRDPHYANVVWDQCLSRGRTALLIAGSSHFTRKRNPDDANGQVEDTTGAIIERHAPGRLLVIHPLDRRALENNDLGTLFNAVPAPALMSIKGSPLARLSASDFFAGEFTFKNGERIPAFQGEVIGDKVDAFLYLGPGRSLNREPTFPPVDDPEYIAWIKSLQERLGIQPLHGPDEEHGHD